MSFNPYDNLREKNTLMYFAIVVNKYPNDGTSID